LRCVLQPHDKQESAAGGLESKCGDLRGG
jgi:hypothetical protein